MTDPETPSAEHEAAQADNDAAQPRRRAATRPAGPPESRPSPRADGSPVPASSPAPGRSPDQLTTGQPPHDTADQPPDGEQSLAPPSTRRSLRRRSRRSGPIGTAPSVPEPRPTGPAGRVTGPSAGSASGSGSDEPSKGVADWLPGPGRRGGDPGDTADPGAAAGEEARPARRRGGRSDAVGERLLRSLVSTRPTQLSPTIAMRAREVGAPTAEDLARAAEEVVIVRRNYVPPAPLSTPRRPTRGRRADGGRGAGSGSADTDGRESDEE
jgi:hypothetical protein